MSAVILSGGRILGASGSLYEILPNGQLAPGHWVTAPMTLTSSRIVMPRPDGETGSTAFHRNAHPSMQYVCPIIVQGGAYPFWYEIISAPSGTSIGQFYTSFNYGIITWTPTSGTQTFTIRVHDQDGVTVDVTWTVTVGTSWVSFVDSTNGSDSNGGTFAAPWATYSHAAATVSGGASICLRSGTYQATTSVQTMSSSTHRSLFAFPNESVTMDCSTSTADGGCWNENASDLYVGNILFSSGPSSKPNPRCFTNQNAGDRLYKVGCSFDNPPQGTAGSGTWDNQACWFLGDPGAQRNYCAMLNCTFSKLPPSGNGYMAYDLYNTKYFVSQGCQFNTPNASTGEQYTMFHKGGGNVAHTARTNIFNVAWGPSNSQLGMYFGSDGSGGQSTDQEFCYNTIVNTNTAATWNSFASIVNNAQNNSFAHAGYSYRNTYVGIPAIFQGVTNTPLTFTSTNDVIVHNATASGATSKWMGVNPAGSANSFINPAGITNVSFTVSGTECQGNTSAGILDGSNNLTGSFLTYLGTRGAQIA